MIDKQGRNAQAKTKETRNKKMRTIRYAVVNKETYKAIFVSLNQCDAIAYLETLTDKDNYYIGHRWFSI